LILIFIYTLMKMGVDRRVKLGNPPKSSGPAGTAEQRMEKYFHLFSVRRLFK
jgi:hypothetical protein